MTEFLRDLPAYQTGRVDADSALQGLGALLRYDQRAKLLETLIAGAATPS